MDSSSSFLHQAVEIILLKRRQPTFKFVCKLRCYINQFAVNPAVIPSTLSLFKILQSTWVTNTIILKSVWFGKGAQWGLHRDYLANERLLKLTMSH